MSICEKFGWTYQEYCDQPLWFIELLPVKLEAERIHNEIELAKAK